MLSIEEMWQGFAKEVYPKNISLIQYKECRRAFFAGFASHFYQQAKAFVILDREDLITQTKFWEKELIAYVEGLKSGIN